MKSAVVLILMMIVGNNIGFEFSDVKTIQVYGKVNANNNKDLISACVGKASRLNREIERILQLSEKLSWSEKAIGYELRKSPQLYHVEPDQLKKTKFHCKVTILLPTNK